MADYRNHRNGARSTHSRTGASPTPNDQVNCPKNHYKCNVQPNDDQPTPTRCLTPNKGERQNHLICKTLVSHCAA